MCAGTSAHRFLVGEVIPGPDGTVAHAEMHYARNCAARDLEGHLWGFGTYWPRDRRG